MLQSTPAEWTSAQGRLFLDSHDMFKQAISIIGAALVLLAYAGQRLKYLSPDGLVYLLMNFLGGAALFYAALATRQTGLIAIEAAWSLISLYGILTLRRKKQE